MVSMVEIKGANDYILRGLLDLPENANEIVVMLHGFTGNRTEHNGHFRTLSRLLSKRNVASLRVDYDCNGESDGEFKDFIFENAVIDALKMVEYAKNIISIEKVYLLGFSMGGAIASIIASNEDISKLILWSPAGNMVHLAHNHYDNAKKLANGNAYFSGFEFSKKFVESIDKFDMYQNTKNYTNEVLIVQGDSDLSVDPNCSYRYNKEFVNSKLHIVKGSGHGYDSYDQMNELYEITLNFI